MNILEGVRRHGFVGSVKKAVSLVHRKGSSGYSRLRYRHAPVYISPTLEELTSIEEELAVLGVCVEDYSPSPLAFRSFQKEGWFPPDCYGGKNGYVWNEKLLEHWISSERLGLMNYGQGEVYVDVAAASSPWAHALRDRSGIEAFAIDLDEVGEAYRDFPYYRVEDATNSRFTDASITGASLHCAYEMFMGEHDTQFIHEAARILKPGGKIIILPLYMHSHYCAYATSEYYGKGFADPAAKEYIRWDCAGVPSSRKYDAAQLVKRVLDPATSLGLSYRLMALRNKSEFGSNIYCHFILEIKK
jgi:hypothetical protein